MRISFFPARIVAVFLAVVFAVSPLRAQSPSQNGAALAAALDLADRGDWAMALQVAAGNQDPIALEIIEWMRLRDGQGTFDEYERFLADNADWPGLPLLQKRSEDSLPEGLKPARIVAYFRQQPPQTGTGALRLARALQALGQGDAAKAEVVRAWTGFSLSEDEQAALWREFSRTLKPYNAERLDLLLWKRRVTEAARMLDIVPDDQRKLAEVRIALQQDKNGVDAMIAALPKSVKGAAGLAYDRFRWRIGKEYWDSAAEMLVQRSTSAAALGRPEFWASKRRTYARRAMRAGDNRTAYLLASQHFLTPDESGYSDLEWLSGFLALRKLNDPARALRHFQKFRASIKSPISVGRAGYWLGRTYEALGDQAKARESYGLGAQYQTSFYGQLAAERGGFAPDPAIAGTGLPPDWTREAFLYSDPVRAGLLLHFAGDELLARRFFAHAALDMTTAEQAALGQLALDLERPNTALKIAKIAAREGQVIQQAYYPLIDLARLKTPVPPEFAMAIARQESELYPRAESPVGALGLMQVMPATAKRVAKDLGIDYSRDKLAQDWEYNATIGTAYLAQMLERYNGSTVLAAAAYNAGPNRADRWIEDYGDPRKPGVDVIDWIETIPFRETRNYVMRVNESLFIYRARISGKVGPLTLSRDLKRGG